MEYTGKLNNMLFLILYEICPTATIGKDAYLKAA
jgi:hypothetical protein